MNSAKIKLILSMLIFGTIGIFVKYIPLPSDVTALTRGITGALFLLAVVFLSKKRMSGTAIKKNLIKLIISGSAIGFNWILLFEAYRYTTVATATLCYYMAPVFVILLSPLILKERLTLTKLLCTAAAAAGMVLVSGITDGGTGSAKGVILGLSAAALYACVMITNKFLKDISAYDSTIMQLSISAAVLLVYTVIRSDLSAIAQADTRSVILLIIVGVLHTGVAYYLYFSALSKLSGQTVAIFSYIDPVTAILLSALLLSERLSAAGIAGAALILGSTLVSELVSAKRNKINMTTAQN